MVMNSFREQEEQFFDSLEEIASVSGFESDSSEDCSPSPGWDRFGYESWTKNLDTTYEQRRSRFMNWMGTSLEQEMAEEEEANNISNKELNIGIDRVGEDSGTVLRDSYLEDRILSSHLATTRCSSEDAEFPREDDDLLTNRNLDNEMEFTLVADGISQNGSYNNRLRQVDTEEFQRTFGSSSLVQWLRRRKDETGEESNNLAGLKKKVKKSWFKKFGSQSSKTRGTGTQRVQVHAYKKNRKELSSLLEGQEIQAHDGAILAMKFSHDGKYLATGGEDGVVRVWKVIDEEEEDNDPVNDEKKLNHHLDIQQTDPSCLYLSVNHLSKLVTLDSNKDKTSSGGGGKMTRKMKKNSQSACVILPQKVFKIMEEPLHEFRGHCGEILALSWSTNGYLLSSSVDETVQLWRVGHHQCLGVFSHNNYVTCIEFNPVDDDYFISGSIDGKVRIWKVQGCKVVDWIDVKEIVTAVCYYPSGNGGLVGSMDGSCRFYDIVDNQFQLNGHVCLQGKKKSLCKRITGFEFSPMDPNKILVTSADSQVRLISGQEVIFKFKGVGALGSQARASFTSDGKRVISASEERSSVHVWNFMGQDGGSPPPPPPRPRKVKKIYSRESFSSVNVSIAIPWCGRKKTTEMESSSRREEDDDLAKCMLENEHFIEELCQRMELVSPDCLLSLRRAFLLDSLTKGTATWPEEKLKVKEEAAPKISRSEYKFFKSACHKSSTSHMWGLVMVAGGWDGRIRTYYNYGLPVRA